MTRICRKGWLMASDDIENLFSYGTLQSEAVQLATFGRRLEGKPDRLIGYRITMIPIRNHKLMATTGGTHHRNIQSTGAASDVVEGTVFTVKTQELEQADKYESTADYERVLVRLESQTKACVYLHSDR